MKERIPNLFPQQYKAEYYHLELKCQNALWKILLKLTVAVFALADSRGVRLTITIEDRVVNCQNQKSHIC